MTELDKTYKINAYFQTTARNIGLYTSISFASLGYSRAHRGKDQIVNVMLILVSIIFTVIALIFATYLLDDIKTFTTDTSDYHYIDKWIIIPQIMYATNIILLLISLYTLYKEMSSR